MDNKKKSIIAGSGRGLLIAEILLKELGCRVAALADTNTAIHHNIKQRLDEYGGRDAIVVRTLGEALKLFPDVDRVFIVTPNTTHSALMEEALEAGCHVFLEKPVAASAEDLDRAARAAANHPDRVIQLGFVLRYSAFYQKVEQMVSSGKLGRILMIQMSERLSASHGACYRRNWRRLIENSGGFLNEKSAHDLDIMCWLKSSQARPVSVYSVGGRHIFQKEGTPESCPECTDTACSFRANARKPFAQEYQLYYDSASEQRCVYRSDADVLNHQHVTVNFSDGSHGHLALIAQSGCEGRDIIIHGLNGYVSGSLVSGRITFADYSKGGNKEDISVIASNMHGGGDRKIISDFFECIESGKQPAATLADGILASRLAFAADKSVDGGLPVKLM